MGQFLIFVRRHWQAVLALCFFTWRLWRGEFSSRPAMWVAVGLAVVGLTMNLVVILINRGMPARVSHDEISDFVIKQGSDGIRLDVKGNLYTTHGNKVHVYNADGKLVGQIEVPENPANLCFGGDDFKTLFITARTSLYSVRVKVAGAKPKGANW